MATTCSSSVGPTSSRSEKRSGSSSTWPTAAAGCEVLLPAKPGPGSGSAPRWWAVAAALARLSAASLSGWPAWPLTHSNCTRRPCIASSSAFISSTFITGLPSLFFQPLRFQFFIHLVIESMTYLLSQ